MNGRDDAVANHQVAAQIEGGGSTQVEEHQDSMEMIMLSKTASARKPSITWLHSYVESDEQNKLMNKTDSETLKYATHR